MKYSNITSYMCAFLLIFGSVFLIQCDSDTRTDRDGQFMEDQDIGMDDRRTGDQDQTINFQDDRDDLVQDIEALRDDLDEELEERADATDEQTIREYEQIQNDRTELERILREVRTTTEDNWNDVRMNARQTYERIEANYNERTGIDGDWNN